MIILTIIYRKLCLYLKKDGKEYGILIDDRIIQEVPYKDVAGYISERYIDLMLYGKDRRNK